MQEMRKENENVKRLPKVTLKELLFTNKALRSPMYISIMVMLAQQLSGINAIMFYSDEIFKMAHFELTAAQMASVGIGIVNVLMTFVSMILVEKAGRKTLLLIGFFGMCIDTLFLTVAFFFKVSLKKIVYYMHQSRT